MKSLCLVGRKRIALVDQPTPQIQHDDEVLLKVAFCGICSSDVLEYTAGPIFCSQPGQQHPLTGARLPLCLGHEYSGTVVRVGANVTSVKLGDRVCVDVAYGCSEQGAEPLCQACTLNYNNACARIALRGLSAPGGGFCQYIVLPSRCLHILPDSIPLDVGALVEPLSIAWHAVRVSGFLKNQTALIVGAGPIGLALILALQAHEAGQIIVSEPGPIRRQHARNLGATHVLDPTKFSSTTDLVAAISHLTPPFYEGVDVSFDCGGEQETLDAVLKTLRLGGTAVNLAIWPNPKAEISPIDVTSRERKFMGSMGFCGEDMDQVLEALDRGIIPMERARLLISSTVTLDNAIEHGFNALIRHRDRVVKILVSPSTSEASTGEESYNQPREEYREDRKRSTRRGSSSSSGGNSSSNSSSSKNNNINKGLGTSTSSGSSRRYGESRSRGHRSHRSSRQQHYRPSRVPEGFDTEMEETGTLSFAEYSHERNIGSCTDDPSDNTLV